MDDNTQDPHAYFYCYSRRCALFIRSMGIFYDKIGTHPVTGAIYTRFEKTQKLMSVLKLWNEIKYRFDSPAEEVTVNAQNYRT